MKQPLLFSKQDLPRPKTVKRMHVADCGFDDMWSLWP
jgi:hypothetical protein